MSVSVMTWVWRQAQVSGNELVVLLAIADEANDTGGNAFPSIASLATKTRLDVRTVRRVLARLTDRGLVEITTPGGGRRANTYRVLMDTPGESPPGQNALPARAERPTTPGTRVTPGRAERPSSPGTSALAARAPVPYQLGHQRPPTHHVPTIDPPPPTPSADPDPVASTTERGGGGGETERVLDLLGSGWPLGAAQRRHLARGIAAALESGWAPDALAEVLGANRDGVRSPFAVLHSRLADLPTPPGTPPPRPPWCGSCDEQTRLQDTERGPRRCPRCHPLTRSDDAAPAA